MLVLFLQLISAGAQVLQRSLIVPEYGNQRVKLYSPTSYPGADAAYSINTSGLCTNAAPNSVAAWGNDLFVAISSGSCQRIYRYPGYLTNPATAISNVSEVTRSGNDYVGMAFDSSGNLYATEGSYNNNSVVCYKASNNYAWPPVVLTGTGMTSYFANIAFDKAGNLWVSDYRNNAIVMYDAANLSTTFTYHIIYGADAMIPVGNTDASLNYACNRIFSRPEGIAFDQDGNLWVANNNDDGANPNYTTLVKLSTALLSAAKGIAGVSGYYTVQGSQANTAGGCTIYNMPNAVSGRSQLGGLQIDTARKRLYVNEQVGGAGLYFDIASIASITNNYASYKLSIVSTNPGNGGLFLVPAPPKSSAKDILSFTFSGMTGNAVIAGNTITAVASSSTNLGNITPVITVSTGATLSPASGVPYSFMNPVVFTVTAEDGSTRQYTVTITRQAPGTRSALYVSGTSLKNQQGDSILLKGINTGMVENGNISLTNATDYNAYIDEMAKTGANAVRMTWYIDSSQKSWRGSILESVRTQGHLENMLKRCRKNRMIPILTIHDHQQSCNLVNWQFFNDRIAAWWKKPDVVSLINNNSDSLIINLANEYGDVSASYENNYNALIKSLRQAGVRVPIMIDAPVCGQNTAGLVSMSHNLLAADSLHNLIFSVHSYWGEGFPNGKATVAEIRSQLDGAVNAGICLVLGEVANSQVGPPAYQCSEIDLKDMYPEVLTEACKRNIGWLAWAWDQDCDPNRNMSQNPAMPSFDHLTPYGTDIVNNPVYGLKTTGSCRLSSGIQQLDAAKDVPHAYPNPASGLLYFANAEKLASVKLYEGASGKLVMQQQPVETSLDLRSIGTGLYWVELRLDNGTSLFQKIIIQ